jgi:hypothetical protein
MDLPLKYWTYEQISIKIKYNCQYLHNSISYNNPDKYKFNKLKEELRQCRIQLNKLNNEVNN